MLEEIGTVEAVPAFIEQVKRKERRLLGFGHRIYKSYDPRARLVRSILHRVFSVCGREPLMLVAEGVERAALYDDYFVSRRLYPNVDFYTGLCYKAMGFPADFFPLLFAVPRMVGWLAHWREQLADGAASRIWRPRQWYACVGGKLNLTLLFLCAGTLGQRKSSRTCRLTSDPRRRAGKRRFRLAAAHRQCISGTQ